MSRKESSVFFHLRHKIFKYTSHWIANREEGMRNNFNFCSFPAGKRMWQGDGGKNGNSRDKFRLPRCMPVPVKAEYKVFNPIPFAELKNRNWRQKGRKGEFFQMSLIYQKYQSIFTLIAITGRNPHDLKTAAEKIKIENSTEFFMWQLHRKIAKIFSYRVQPQVWGRPCHYGRFSCVLGSVFGDTVYGA